MSQRLGGRIVYCSVCSSGRELRHPELPWGKIAVLTVLWALLLGGAVGLLFAWTSGIWTGLICGVLCFIGLEVYYTQKFKGELVCPVCHFDPVLYRKSPEEAKQRCLEFLKSQEEAFAARWQRLKSQELGELRQ